jgi:ABC-2 type transport system ATP-binding protein
MNTNQAAVSVAGLSHRYGNRTALDSLTLRVQRGEIFAILGPNGGGKTTLFRVLSTLVSVQAGQVDVLGFRLPAQAASVRRRIGVVFQAPSLDRKLTVAENIRFQAAMYGIRGSALAARSREMLDQLGLADRVGERAESLSGGLRRRVELAKGMIHRPEMLLLDEPSAGLDPGARSDLWEYLFRLRDQNRVTVVVTTHLLDEAERADRIAILNQGQLVAMDTPAALKASVGGDSITIRSRDPETLRGQVERQFQVNAMLIDGQVRFEHPDGSRLLARITESLADSIDSITLGKPTLEDVFIDKTGHRFWSKANEDDQH